MAAIRSRGRRAISTLEMIVTLTIAVLVITAVLAVYRGTVQNSEWMTLRVERQAQAMAGMDRMMDDVIGAAFAKPDIRIESGGADGCIRLIIQTLPETANLGPTTQVDWATVPGDRENELILYRRQTVGKDKEALYIPVCEHLLAFDAELFNPEGLDDPNAPPSMLDVQLTLYRDDPPDPDRVFSVFRTFCLRRK